MGWMALSVQLAAVAVPRLRSCRKSSAAGRRPVDPRATLQRGDSATATRGRCTADNVGSDRWRSSCRRTTRRTSWASRRVPLSTKGGLGFATGRNGSSPHPLTLCALPCQVDERAFLQLLEEAMPALARHIVQVGCFQFPVWAHPTSPLSLRPGTRLTLPSSAPGLGRLARPPRVTLLLPVPLRALSLTAVVTAGLILQRPPSKGRQSPVRRGTRWSCVHTHPSIAVLAR
jgi:hypothetical protein